MSVIGSYANGFSPRDGQPLYPELWRGCVGAWAPCLGPTGVTLRDWSGFGNHGTLTNMDAGSDWLPSAGRYALDFDGVNDHVVLPTSPSLNLSGDMSAFAWIFPRTVSLQSFGRGIVSSFNSAAVLSQFSFEINRTAAKLTVLANGGSIALTSTQSLVANTWYHVGFTRSSSTGSRVVSIYINGKLDSSASGVAAPEAQQVISIGRQGAWTNPSFDGMIDSVMLHNRVLTAAEIAILASRRGIAYDLAPRKRTRTFAGFKAYWAARKALILGGGL